MEQNAALLAVTYRKFERSLSSTGTPNVDYFPDKKSLCRFDKDQDESKKEHFAV